ncbi:transketolase [Bacteroidia bacterium]|nr:transketolase [Bacteroidia bacterium]
MNKKELQELQDKCRHIRYLIIEEIGKLGVGHLGGSMSAVEALVILYYKHMNIDPQNPKLEGRDRFILSKGHAGPTLYAVLADKGYFDRSWLGTLNQPGTNLPSHADMNRTPGVDMTTGSLGQGFSCAVGIAIGSKLKKDNARIYTMIGDGETDEGLIWEAAMYAGHKKLYNLIAFTDYNKMQLDGGTEEINGLEPLSDKWRSFGWDVYEAQGHDLASIDAAVEMAKNKSGNKPSMILLHTLKGKGVSFLEANWKNNHNVTINEEQMKIALNELKEGESDV